MVLGEGYIEEMAKRLFLIIGVTAGVLAVIVIVNIYNMTVLTSSKISDANKDNLRKAMIKIGFNGLTDVNVVK